MATRSHHHNLLTATAIVIGTLLIVNYGFYYAVVRMATDREGRMRGAEDDSDAVWSVFRDDDGVSLPMSVADWNALRRDMTRGAWTRAYNLISTEAGERMNRRVIFAQFPSTIECDKLFMKRIGGNGDGSKWACMEYFPMTSGCVVVSVGSNGNFGFELGVVQESDARCQVITLDCSGTWTPPHPNIHFYPWCLAELNRVQNGRIYKTWDTVIEELGLTRIDFLKMDIESYEWSVLPLMLEHPEHALLPRQIAVELHMFPPEHVKNAYAHFITETGTFQPPGTPSDMVAHNGLDYLHPMIRLFQKFDAAGYQVAASEYNPVSIAECCQEFVLVRA